MNQNKVKTKKDTLINFKVSMDFRNRVADVARMEGKKVSVLIRDTLEAKVTYMESLQPASRIGALGKVGNRGRKEPDK